MDRNGTARKIGLFFLKARKRQVPVMIIIASNGSNSVSPFLESAVIFLLLSALSFKMNNPFSDFI